MKILFSLRAATPLLPCCRQGSNSACGGTAAAVAGSRICLHSGHALQTSMLHSRGTVPTALFIETNKAES